MEISAWLVGMLTETRVMIQSCFIIADSLMSMCLVSTLCYGFCLPFDTKKYIISSTVLVY